MAEITVKGYVNKPTTRESAKGPYASFTLAERQKQKDGTFKKVYYSVADFKSPAPPPESSFVTLRGWFNIVEVEKEGRKFTNLNINAQEVTIAPPLEGKGPAPAGGKDNFDDIPF